MENPFIVISPVQIAEEIHQQNRRKLLWNRPSASCVCTLAAVRPSKQNAQTININ